METCKNCGYQIGNLETPHIWQNESIVCENCYKKLSGEIPQVELRLSQKTKSKIKNCFILLVIGLIIIAWMLVASETEEIDQKYIQDLGNVGQSKSIRR